MKNTTTTIIFLTLVCNPDYTFNYTVFTDQEIFNEILGLLNNTFSSYIPNISHIEIPEFKEPFNIFKPTFLSTAVNNDHSNTLGILIEQAKIPRTYFVSPKLYWYNIPFYFMGLYLEPLSKLCYSNVNDVLLIPAVGTSFIVFSSLIRNNNDNDNIEDENNPNVDLQEETINTNTTNAGPSRQHVVPSPYENIQRIVPSPYENTSTPFQYTIKHLEGFFYWDCFFDFLNGFTPYSAIHAGVEVIEAAPDLPASEIVELILAAVRYSQYRHLRSIRNAIHLLNGNIINSGNEWNSGSIREVIQEYLQYYVNTKIHLDILEYKYPEVYDKLKNFHYPVLYITEKDWNVLKNRVNRMGDFNLLDVVKDRLFIIVPNYDNVQDYLISESDNNYFNNYGLFNTYTRRPGLIRYYEPEDLLRAICIFDNQDIENIIGLSVQEWISLISSLKQEEENSRMLNQNLTINETNNNNTETISIPKKSNIFKKLKEKVKKFIKKIKK